jgi:DNA-binding transcriptional MocR family regulator
VPVERRIAPAALSRIIGPLPPGTPTYRGLADAVRRAVLDGALPVGTRVPSERELAGALGLSRTTTAAAYQRLRDQGVLRTRRGSGSVTALPRGTTSFAGLLVPDSADSGPVDLSVAAPEAPAGFAEAAQRALGRLPLHSAGGGYAYLGLPDLRARLAERYTSRGVPTTPEQILVTSGAQAATSLLLATLVGPGDRVAVENPAYPHSLAAIRAAGARPVAVPVTSDGLDLDLMEATLRQASPRLVHVTPDHQNPTGTSLSPEARARLRHLAARYRTPVVGDETLTDLTFDGEAPPPFLGSAPDEHLIAVGSASKSFWGGLRLGWVRAHRDVVLRLGQARVHRDLSTGVLEQLVLTELLEDADTLLADRRAELRVRRDALLAAMHAALPWRARVPAGGLSLWVDLGAPVSSTLAAVAAGHGVRVAPGSAFGVDGGFEQRLRLPFAAPVDRLERGVAGLASAWQGLAVAPTPAPVEAVPI